MATSSNADSTSASESNDVGESDSPGETAAREATPPSPLARLETAARSVRLVFFGFVVTLALLPVVALWLGAAPFDAPPTGPYFALVLAALVGTAALIAVAVYDA